MKRKLKECTIRVKKSIRTAMMVAVLVLVFSGAFVCLPVTTISTYAATITKGYVNAGDVNIRSGPGIGYKSLGKVSYAYVIINGQIQGVDGYTWYSVTYGSIDGYIRGDLITDITSTEVDPDGFLAFPESFRDSLALIKSNHPNYEFVPEYINYTLEEAASERVGRKVYYDDNGDLVRAPYSAIYYYMDPATYLNEDDIFVFAEHYYNSSQNVTGLKNLVTAWGSSFLDSDSYITALSEAGKKYDVSPYVLAATALQEKGWYAHYSNPDVKGRLVYAGTVNVPGKCLSVRTGPGTEYRIIDYVDDKDTIYIYDDDPENTDNAYEAKDHSLWYSVIYEGKQCYVCKEETIEETKYEYITDYREYKRFYNFFSVGQVDDNPDFGGLGYAMKEGWDTPEKSLVGGAAFYKDGYVNNGQDTYYYKDFNVIHDKSEWWHEYATGLQDPIESATILSFAYDNDPDAKVTFAIPIYKDYDKPVVQQPQIFPDVNSTDWFYDSVNFVNNKGLMTGMGDGTFNPSGELTREQFAVILWRIDGSPSAENTGYFSDVPAGTWFTDAVYWAYGNGVITGYGGTDRFGTGDSITREQFVTMLYRFAGYKKWSTGEQCDISGYSDAENVSDWAKRAMEWAVARGVLTGKDGGKLLAPSDITKRCECAEMLYRYY